MLCAVGSCLGPEPPEYKNPDKTPPVLLLAQADPSITQIVSNKSSGDTVPITVPLRSEDFGEDLAALLYLDYDLPGEARQAPFLTLIEPSTFDDRRDISLSWTVPSGKAGCHQLTLVVSHFSSLDRQTQEPLDESDVALATWWVRIDDENETATLASCPTKTGGGS